jgi:hypothetical protein
MSTPSTLKKMLSFRNEVIQILDSQRDILNADEYKEVMHLIHHNENGEALHTLAFILVEECKPVSDQIFERIGKTALGFIDLNDMPEVVRKYMNDA